MGPGFVTFDLVWIAQEVLSFKDSGDPNVSGVRGVLQLGPPKFYVQFEGESRFLRQRGSQKVSKDKVWKLERGDPSVSGFRGVLKLEVPQPPVQFEGDNRLFDCDILRTSLG